MASLSRVRVIHSGFGEEKRLAGLNAPLLLSGTLRYVAPSYLEKRIEQPVEETVQVDGDRLRYSKPADGIDRFVGLDDAPELRALVEAVRATLAGDLVALEHHYRVAYADDGPGWRLTLTPRDAGVAALVESMRIEGEAARLSAVLTVEANGDTSVMTLDPGQEILPRP
ncbi:MAG TPA: hypothetical protein PKA13_15800 [Geminicoccaceae bacterium]|nr:hypothetical protein [Geminicoccus sp.]HMU51238.1 hypothetical protein [Geminicoccaceae bacterium]